MVSRSHTIYHNNLLKQSRYSPDLHQNTSITGLSKLVVPDTYDWPKRILYPVEYFPLANPAAELILLNFLSNVSKIFEMEIEYFNFSSVFRAAVDTTDLDEVLNILDSYHQYHAVAKPLITAWKELFDGRFPPVDPGWRASWRQFNETTTDASVHAYALQKRAEAVAWSEKNFLYSTNDSCSESILILDIGTGGLPSFREQDLMTDNPAASFLAVTPADAAISAAAMCPSLAWWVTIFKVYDSSNKILQCRLYNPNRTSPILLECHVPHRIHASHN